MVPGIPIFSFFFSTLLLPASRISPKIVGKSLVLSKHNKDSFWDCGFVDSYVSSAAGKCQLRCTFS